MSFRETEQLELKKSTSLLKEGIVSNAGEVLFCDENSLEVQLAVFAGTDKITFLDIKQYKGSIFDLLERMETYIKEHIDWRVKFGELRRKEIPEIPVDAVREALVNSLCHRDYLKPENGNKGQTKSTAGEATGKDARDVTGDVPRPGCRFF